MNATYSPHLSPLCHRETRPDTAYRTSPVYTTSSTIPLPTQQSHIPPAYGAPFIPLASSRANISDPMHVGDTNVPLPANGQQPFADPKPTSRQYNGKKYQLVVVQQPQRARMCGFGDKDRRPITPPPCVKLIVTDVDTGKESDFNAIEHGMFVLNVDLWAADGRSEVNLVRQTANSPSITSTISGPFPGQFPGFVPQSGPNYTSPSNYSQPPTPQQMFYNAPPIRTSPPRNYSDIVQGPQAPFTMNSFVPQEPSHRVTLTSPPQGMYTRNLIGSLAASAFRLTDPEDKIGIWFVLQDLSVRTEGEFRLRFSFVNVSEISPPPPNTKGRILLSKAPVLARCYSDKFSVYSAKRFPGVVESTPLSRCFASQGIKIPIRKDAAKAEKAKGEE